jgi:glucose-6-phosphate isomerase
MNGVYWDKSATVREALDNIENYRLREALDNNGDEKEPEPQGSVSYLVVVYDRDGHIIVTYAINQYEKATMIEAAINSLGSLSQWGIRAQMSEAAAHGFANALDYVKGLAANIDLVLHGDDHGE